MLVASGDRAPLEHSLEYYMGISYFLDYFLTPITSATVISVHAKAHYGRAKITQWWECLPPRKWGLGSNPGIDTIRGLLFAPYMGISYFLDYLTRITSATVISVHAKAHSLLREIFLQVLWFSLLKNHHFQIPIQPGMADKEPKCGCATSKSLFM